jgi:acid phosphatase (class A)
MLRAALLLLIALLPFAAQAAYLDDDGVDVVRSLDPAPKITSAAAKADLAASEHWQVQRTGNDCARANQEMHVNLQVLFAGPGGPLTEAEANRLSPFFQDVKEDGENFSRQGKAYWRRLRPYLQWKDSIKLCAGMEPPYGFSYPSGHATDSRVFARVLGEIFPARKGAFLARADEVAENRVIEGAHYVSDVEAGKKLGDLIFAALLRNEAFREDLRKQK